MTRVAWIGNALDPEAREALRVELDRILPGSPHQRAAFLDAADEALDEYHKLLQPAAAAAELMYDRLEQLEELAQRFVEANDSLMRAVATLDDDLRDLIDLHRWTAAGRRGDPPDFSEVETAVRLALEVAAAARDTLVQRKTSFGPRLGGAVPALVEVLAHAYARIFGERPSAGVRGTFARALAAVLEAGGIRAELGEKKLAGIFDRAGIGGVRPKRGRKVQN